MTNPVLQYTYKNGCNIISIKVLPEKEEHDFTFLITTDALQDYPDGVILREDRLFFEDAQDFFGKFVTLIDQCSGGVFEAIEKLIVTIGFRKAKNETKSIRNILHDHFDFRILREVQTKVGFDGNFFYDLPNTKESDDEGHKLIVTVNPGLPEHKEFHLNLEQTNTYYINLLDDFYEHLVEKKADTMNVNDPFFRDSLTAFASTFFRKHKAFENEYTN